LARRAIAGIMIVSERKRIRSYGCAPSTNSSGGSPSENLNQPSVIDSKSRWDARSANQWMQPASIVSSGRFAEVVDKGRMLTRSQPARFATTVPPAYRPDIDGLRAVSILAVVGYHAFPASVSGGFVGVDIFFVISGFLITRIIVTELATDSFSILAFYQRRVRRIFPTLIVVLATTYAVGWMVLLPRDFKLLGDNILGGAGFFANFVQLRTLGYFAPDASTNPLLHLWSLAIEEQFYIFWPLLLLLLNGRRFRTAAISMIGIGSLAANIYLVTEHQAIAFYSPATRAWELLAGALLVRSNGDATARFPAIADDIKGAAGLLLIGLAMGLLDHTTGYPGWGALLPVVGAALLIEARGSIVNRRLLSHPAMIFIGLVSYPLYLWHWPLLCYLGILRGGDPTALEKDLVIALAFAVACGTYTFIERPIRRRRNAVIGLGLAMGVMGGIGVGTILASGLGFRFPSEIGAIASLPIKENAGFRADCFLESDEISLQRRARCIEGGAGPLIFVWGDSTAAALYPGLKQAQQHHAFHIAQFTSNDCPPILGHRGSVQCTDVNRETFDIIATILPDIVLLHAMWRDDTNFRELRETIASLRRIGIARIVMVGPVPLWKRTLPFMLVNAYRLQHRLPERISTGVSGAAVDNLMRQFSEDEHVEYFSVWNQFCNPDGCLARTGPSAADVVVKDQAHLSTKGSEFLVRAITSDLLTSEGAGLR
jgi:peptidoglycan/LPS O-acetylase OafA/YrhL